MPICPLFGCRCAAILMLVLPVIAPAKLLAGDESHLVRVTYQVADLVIPVPSVVCVPAGPAKAATATQEERLIKLITSTVEPKSWVEKGGPGSIDYHRLTMSLVVCQTPDIQEQTVDLLNSLRRLQDTQVSLEVRLITVDDGFVERMGLDGKDGTPIKPAAASASPLRARFLNDEQVVHLLEAAQGDRQVNVLQAPKLTVLNGQTCVLDITEPESFVTGIDYRVTPNGNAMFTPQVEKIPVGLRMTAKSVVSADRRFVKVSLNVDLSSLSDPKADLVPVQLPTTTPPGADGESPKEFTQLIQCPRITRLAVDSTVNIPDGGTVLMTGLKREREVRNECGVPVLRDIPYVGRLFKTLGYGREKECVLVMVTPRIIVEQEDEQRQTGFHLEQAACACPGVVEPVVAPPCCRNAEAAALVEKYHQACAAGRMAEATQLAVKALALDPACFHNDCPPAVAPCVTSSPAGR